MPTFTAAAHAESPYPYIPRFAVQKVFGSRVAAKAQEYVSDEHIRRLQWITNSAGTKGELVAQVAGGAPEPYRTRVSVASLGESVEASPAAREETAPVGDAADSLSLWTPGQSTCTCPVGLNCKHGAALALAAGAKALDWAEATAREAEAAAAHGITPHSGNAGQGDTEAAPEPSWRDILAPLMRDTDDDTDPEIPLALGFELYSEQLQPTRFSWGNEPLTAAHLEAGKNVFLAIRPLKRGRRNNWIKSGLSWRSFEFRVSDHGFNPVHADALTRIFALAESERSHTYGPVEQLWVNTFRSHLVWESLERAREAGVAFVGLGNVGAVRLGHVGDVELNVAQAPAGEGADGLRLTAEATLDGERVTTPRLLGSTGLISIESTGGKASGASEQFDIALAPTPRQIPQHLQRLLERGAPVTVPAAESEQFLTQAVPRLKRVAPVNSADGSVVLPEPEGPTLRVHAMYAGKNSLRLTWLFAYEDVQRRFSIHTRAGAGRDLAAEDALLAEVRTFWPTAGGARAGEKAEEGTETLTDVDTAYFTSHALPELEAMSGVKVEISGTRHEYRELDGSPHIRVTQTENPEKNDWFDLGFTITMDGRTIPFPTLFVALAKGQSKVLLEDRTYFSLDHPEFDVLRALIHEGEALAEWEPERQQISKYQVGFWEDLADAADIAESAAAWKATVGKLQGLDTIPATEPPSGLLAQLRPYQQEGFSYLAFLHRLGLGGILADDMGLGKTLQTLALIQHAKEAADARPATVGAESSRGGPAPFLVVAPSSVVSVWQQEAARFTPELNVAVIDQTRRARGTWVRDLIRGADLVITSYTILRIDADEFAREQFAGFVLDEAQFVKNRTSRVHQSAKRIKAPFRLAITGTPMENSLADVWALMSIVAPGVLGPHVQFRSEFTQPIESGEHPEKMEILRRRLRPFMLRRTKELVAKDLPEKQEQVLRIELESAHRKLYDSVLQRERKKVLGLLDDMDKNRFIVFRSLTLLRMLALDPAIVDEGSHEGVASSKMNALMERLSEIVAEGHRVLVFSQFTTFLSRVGERLQSEGVAFSYLDGSTTNRAGVIEHFREGTNPVFLISLKAGGFGLTLTEADYVFLLDPWWNPAAENQAIDRAHRIGQTERVMVYRLVAEDTIEEKVLALQDKKRALFDSLTGGGDAFSKAITAEDVRSLLE